MVREVFSILFSGPPEVQFKQDICETDNNNPSCKQENIVCPEKVHVLAAWRLNGFNQYLS
jgi:hypothetical protein